MVTLYPAAYQKARGFSAFRWNPAPARRFAVPDTESGGIAALVKMPFLEAVKIQYFYIEKRENPIYIYTGVC